MRSISILFALLAWGAQAQESGQRFPITVSVFSESLGLPGFRSFFKNPNIGIRIGTELYYRNKTESQTFQTLQIGYYHHRNFHKGIFVSSEFGYRHYIQHAFVDASIGAGYLLVNSALPRYEQTATGYRKTSSSFGRVMPSLGIGAGYRFKSMSVFSRYELFGEMPFGFMGLPALPHQTLHVGTRFNLLK